MMRILVITNLYPNPYQPNRSTFNRQQIRALAGRHELRIIAPILWTEEWAARRKGPARLSKDRRTVCDGIPVSHPRYLYPPKFGRRWYGRCFRRCIRTDFRQALTDFRPDIVFTPWVYPDGWAAVDLAHRAGLPVVLKAHGSDVHTWDAYPARQDGTATALREADGVVAVSQDLSRRIIALGAPAGRIQVVYDGIDTDCFCPGSRSEARQKLAVVEETPLILFIGNLVPVKGLDVLLKACAILARQGRRFTTAIIGGGPLRSSLEQESKKLGLSERVIFHGPRPHGQLPDWYRAADVFVLPSRSEGVPVVLLEAAACGTPFVASEVGGIPEIAPWTKSRLVPPDEAELLAAALGQQLDNRAASGTVEPYRRRHEDAAAELTEFFGQIVHRQRAFHKTLAVASSPAC